MASSTAFLRAAFSVALAAATAGSSVLTVGPEESEVPVVVVVPVVAASKAATNVAADDEFEELTLVVVGVGETVEAVM